MATSKTKKIGKYEILDVLGRGGMGVVYKAVDPSIGRPVAIKMITGNYAEDPNFLKRFYREAQSTGKLQHPNIVIVYELGEYEGSPFLVMEFLEGESLDVFIKAKRSLTFLQQLNYMVQVCNGLQYAHQRNVVHRDIKPANVMVLKGGQVKIVDFGIARIEDDSNVTMPSQVIGTIQYMSPEQINGKHVDGRSDVFSTAVVMYQLLTFHLPFDGQDTGSTLLKIINDPPPPLSDYLESYPPELDNILRRALAKSRDERYQTAEELAFDLGQIQEQLQRDAAEENLRAAQQSLERGELSKAREQCFQILRFDRQDTRAKQLLQEVQQRLQRQQRSEQAQQLRSQAQEAMAAEELDRALVYLCQAVELDPEDPELLAFRDAVRDAKMRADQHRDAVKRAQSAHYAGDLTEALQAIEQAIALDSSDTDAQALRAEIMHEVEQRRRHSEIQELVQEAQRQIASRRFTAALEALQKAEALDPAAPGVRELMTLAASGREQEKKRKDLERLSAGIAEALNQDDYATACRLADDALTQFPDDRGLLKLKSMAERRRQASEKRQYIEEQIAAARRLLDQKQTETALRNLEAACERFPNEPALLSVLTIVKQTLQQEKEEARKNEYIQRAKDALRGKRFAEAIQVLETACAEASSPELEDMLQYAREEAAAFERQQRVEAAAAEAQRLMGAEQYEQAITFLHATLAEVADEDLQIILAEAERRLEDFNRRIAECVETAERLLRVDRVTEAVRYLDSQPTAIATSAPFREVSARARECQQRLRRIAVAVEKARAALSARKWPEALETIEECRRATGDHPELARVAAQIAADREQAAANAVTKATNDCRMLFLGRSYEAALQMLESVAGLVEFVPDDLRVRYTAMHEEAERGILRKQQEAELARAKSELSTQLDDTAERTPSVLAATTRQSTAEPASRERDVEELQQLSQDAESTATLEELSAISARARVLASRHDNDSQVQTIATQVLTNAAARAEAVTSIVRGSPPAPASVGAVAAVPVEEAPTPAETGVAVPAAEAPAPMETVVAVPVEEVRPAESTTDSPIITPSFAPPEAAPAGIATPMAEAAPSTVASSGPPAVAEPPAASADTPEQVEAPWMAAEQFASPAEVAADLAVVEASAGTQPVAAEPEQPAVAEASAPESLTMYQAVPVRAPAELPLAAGAENATVLAPPRPPAPPVERRPAPSEPKFEPKALPPRPAPVVRMEPRRPAPPPRGPSLVTKPRVIAAAAALLVVVVALVVWKLWPSTPTGGKTMTSGRVLVVNSKPEGAVIQVQNQTCVTPNCRLQLVPGDYELKASLPGYKPESRVVHISSNTAPPEVSLGLAALPTHVRISTNLSSGDVTLDGKPAGTLRQGQLELSDVDAGQHTVKVSGTGEGADITFEAAPARPPQIRGTVNATGLAAVAVSSLAGHTQLDCNCDAGATLTVDGTNVGPIKSGHQDLGELAAGSHQVQVGTGNDARTHLVHVSAAPALDLFLDGKRNVGILVVQAGIPDAAVYLDGRKAGVTGNDGLFRASLPVKPVSVRVAKSGYKNPPQQTANLRSNGETGLTFELQPVADKAKLVVAAGEPDTSVSLDGGAIGALRKSGQFTADIPPGNHTIEFTKLGFEPKRINRSFAAGETAQLTADLKPLPKPQPKAPTPPSMTDSASSQPLTSPVQPPATPPPPSPDQQEWQRTRDSKDPAVLQAFLSRYPSSSLAGEARDRLRQLQVTADREGVLQTLKRYADAYAHKSTGELEAIWPTLDKEDRKKIADSFKSADAISVDLKPSGEPAISGESATVTCDRASLYTFPGGQQKTFSDRVVIRLRKKSGTWLIESVS